MSTSGIANNIWVQATPFIPGNPSFAEGSGEMQPSTVDIVKSVDPNLDDDDDDDDVKTQLQRERANHEITKHMLHSEQEKVRKVQAELDDSRRLTSSLVAANRLNAQVLRVAIDRIEPNVDRVLKMVSLTTPSTVSHHHAANIDADPGILLDDRADSSGTSSYSLQLPDSSMTDQRPSLLYDVLLHYKTAGDLDRRPDLDRSVQEDVWQVSDETDHEEQEPMYTPGDQAPTPHNNEVDTWLPPVQHVSETGRPSLNEFHSLDQAFESDIFSKSIAGEGSRTSTRLSEREMSDDTLIEVFPGQEQWPKSEKVNDGNSKVVALDTNTSKLAQLEELGEIDSDAESKTRVSQNAIGTIILPSLGVETRTITSQPLQFDSKPWEHTPEILTGKVSYADLELKRLGSLPTLRLPSSSLTQATTHKASTASSDSTISPRLEETKSLKLALAGVFPHPINPQIKALKKDKMSEASNSSEETVRPSSAQRRNMSSSAALPVSDRENDPTVQMAETGVESTVYHHAGGSGYRIDPLSGETTETISTLPNAEESGYCTNFYSGREIAERLSPVSHRSSTSLFSNIRPSSASSDTYSVIPVTTTNYHATVRWSMSAHSNPLFESPSEMEQIQRRGDQEDMMNSPIWLYPVRYEPSIFEPNTHRTVQIDHIPRNAAIQDVLEEVCWGTLESIVLADVGNVKGPQGLLIPAPYKFARIVFFKERQADRFHPYGRNKPLTILGQEVRVYLQMEPTYPRLAEVDTAIYDEGMTRILSVFGLSDYGRERLPGFLQWHGLDLVALEMRTHVPQEDEFDPFTVKTVVEFRSILHAYRAMNAMKDEGYPGADGFMVETDYCLRKA